MPSLDELKATRSSIQTLFAVLMQGTWKGEAVEAVAAAKKFVDSMYLPVQADIEKLEKTFTENLKDTIAEANLESKSVSDDVANKPAEPTVTV